MNRQEFVDRLRGALSGSLSNALVMDYVNYYEEYIYAEMQKGRSEESVLNSLGDPRLIARTIIQTNVGDHPGGSAGTTAEWETYREEGAYRTMRRDYGQVAKQVRIPGWVWALIVILIVVMVIGIIISVLSFLAPILVPVLIVLFLVKLFRDWLN